MMCYRDMQFCKFWDTCKDGKCCFRAFTPEVKKRAHEWTEKPLICFFSEKPDCYRGGLNEKSG